MNDIRIRKKAGLHWYHWIVVSGSIVLTFIAWYISNQTAQEKIRLQFDFESEQLLGLVVERMSRYEDALRAGVAAIHSQSQGIDAEEWRRFSNTLQIDKRYPGINGIGVIYYVRPEKLDEFILLEKQQRSDFKVHPVHKQKEHWPITYIEPLIFNAQAVGLDIAFENNRLTAAKKARDTRSTQITAPINLVQDSKNTPGFLQYVPIYISKSPTDVSVTDSVFIGHVYAPFIMNKLIEGGLSQQNRRLLFSVYDNNELLYSELENDNYEFDKSPVFERSVSIDMYGRPWDFTIQTGKSFAKHSVSSQPKVILISGLVIDTLLFLLFISLSKANKKAVILAENMTKELAERENYFRHIVEAAPCGIIVVDDKGLIEEVNSRSGIIFGFSKSELIGQSVDVLVPNNMQERHSRYRDTFEHLPPDRTMGLSRIVFGQDKNGRKFPAEIGLAKISGLSTKKTIATITDMSEYVAITDELKRSNKDLNEFAYVASHDLKTPLRGIMQLASWIEEDLLDVASEDTLKYLATLKNRTFRLEKLLDDLLDYSKVGRVVGDIKEVDCKVLINNIFDLLDPPKGFSITVQSDTKIISIHKTPLEIALRNLLSNAIKHNDKEKGVINVLIQHRGDKIEFTVEDNGPGIDEQYFEQIFELFKTLQPRDIVEGSGMGLAIVKKIVEAHGGKILVSSTLGRGASFTFTWATELQDLP
jgi:PAS domain S-box-containing protein